MLDNPVHILIDTDGGSDDLAAIGIAIQEEREGKVIIDAITCVDGNVELRQVYNNVKTLLYHLNREDIPVYCGASEPLVRNCVRAYSTHGHDGLGDKGLSESFNSFHQDMQKTIEVIATVASNSNAKIICIGPLTNIAVAYKMYPNKMKNAQIYAMASAGFGEGNVTPRVEFNVWQDPEAAAIVTKKTLSSLHISNMHYIGWDTCNTYDAMLGKTDIQSLDEAGYATKFFVNINSTLIKMNEQRFSAPTLDFADPIAMSIALEPDICGVKYHYCNCDIDTNSESHNYGSVDPDILNLFDDPNEYMCKYFAGFAKYHRDNGLLAKTFLITTLLKLNEIWRS